MPLRYTFVAIAKLLTILVLAIGTTYFFVYTYFLVTKGRGPRVSPVSGRYNGKDVVILPYTTKSYSGYGRVFEPEIQLRVQGENGTETKVDFLLDSGAVVSTLPITYVDILDKDIENAQRIVLRGFGDKRTFGYMSNMDVLVKDQTVNVPVVFSEGETTKKILGRNGFFDVFTIVFDHKDQVIRLAQ
jgi:hypothetical protein